MSITFEIVKFKKPTKDDLSNLHMFNPYGSIPILDDDGAVSYTHLTLPTILRV